MPKPTTLLNKDGASEPTCVICLESVSERAIALPCGHDCFDLPCLGSWLVTKKPCPVCKRLVERLEYDGNSPSGPKLFELLLQQDQHHSTLSRSQPEDNYVSSSSAQNRGHQQRQQRRRHRRFDERNEAQIHHEAALERRRHVYRHGLLSLHVGSNRVSQYQEFSAARFRNDQQLISRARMWIRRELQVFRFLHLDDDREDRNHHPPDSSSPCHQRRQDQPYGHGRRATSDAEFLLEYIIAMLKVTDIRASGGQAEELLTEFLGRRNTRIFLHELHAWLRSPYRYLGEWDDAVQYGEVG